MEERTSAVHPISLSPLLLGTGGGDVVYFDIQAFQHFLFLYVSSVASLEG